MDHSGQYDTFNLALGKGDPADLAEVVDAKVKPELPDAQDKPALPGNPH
ncbi:MAG: hypothetical protein HZA50_19165 [Planctomycetes bacterium]|nr:hypothetical protein [Planctomycetota bacterium]